MAMVFIKVGFPNFIPFWFLLFFIPATLYLAYHQTAMLTLINEIHFPCFPNPGFRRKIEKGSNDIQPQSLVFWVMLTIVTLVGGAVQTHSPNRAWAFQEIQCIICRVQKTWSTAKAMSYIAEGDPEPITGFEPAYSMLVALGSVEAPQSMRHVSSTWFCSVSASSSQAGSFFKSRAKSCPPF